MNILGIIPARGDSKGVPRKNVRELCGKPMIAYTIETALTWGRLDYLIVSTDDDEIARVSKRYGAIVPFKRSPELSTDEAGVLEVIKHAVRFFEDFSGRAFETVVQLDATSPLRTVEDLEGAFNLFVGEDLDMTYSVCHAGRNPYFNMVELDKNGIAHICKKVEYGPFVSRQSAPAVYEMNSSIYIYKKDYLLGLDSFNYETSVYVMPEDRSIDIDREIDLKLAALLLRGREAEGS